MSQREIGNKMYTAHLRFPLIEEPGPLRPLSDDPAVAVYPVNQLCPALVCENGILSEFLFLSEPGANSPNVNDEQNIEGRSRTTSIEDVIAELAQQVPEAAWDSLPHDLSSSRTLDNYLYGIESE